MTDRSLATRNRQNAQRSTGPKTPSGKATSARNARRHGATSAPAPRAVSAWLAVILDRPNVTMAALDPSDERGIRALALAKAEVRLASAQVALAEFDEQRIHQFNIEEILRAAADETQCPVRRRNQADEMLQQIMAAEIAARSQRPLLARYLREAQSRRRRALYAWLVVSQSGNHRNEARLQPEEEFT